VIGLLLSLAGLWILLAAIWAAVWPLFVEGGAPPRDADVELRELEAEKARLLQEIHELELDYETGKLSDEDHQAIEARLKGRTVEVMKRIDALSAPQPRRGSSAVRAPRRHEAVGESSDVKDEEPARTP
jgi:hypothetical protein